MFMNEHEIDDALHRFRSPETPNLFVGAQVLDRLCRWTNANSDGWPYWSKPSRAAEKLMGLLKSADRFDPTDCTAAELKAACTPIKAFLTKQGVDHALVFPALTPGRKYVLVTETETITREFLVETDLNVDAVTEAVNEGEFRPLEKAPSRVVRLDRECDDIRPAPADTNPADYR